MVELPVVQPVSKARWLQMTYESSRRWVECSKQASAKRSQKKRSKSADQSKSKSIVSQVELQLQNEYFDHLEQEFEN